MFILTRPAIARRHRFATAAATRAFIVNAHGTLAGFTVTLDLGDGPADVTAEFAATAR